LIVERAKAALRGFGVDGAFENDIDLIAESGRGFADGSGREFQDRCGMCADRGEAPGLQGFFKMDHFAVAIKIKRIDGKAHGEGMNAVARADPESASAREGRGIGGHEAAKARPVGASKDEIGGEVDRASAIEGVGRGSGRSHRDRVIG